MSAIEPRLLAAIKDLERGLTDLSLQFAIVGALVPELSLRTKPTTTTYDADVIVAVRSLGEFDRLKDQLSQYGFGPTRVAHRLRHREGSVVDLLPYDRAFAPDGRLEIEQGRIMNVVGFDHIFSNVVPVASVGGIELPVIPLPLYALLKLVAYSDRTFDKDLVSVLHCLEHYSEEDDRRYGLEFEEQAVPFEFTCAYLLGADGKGYLDERLQESVGPVLESCGDPEGREIVALVRARESSPLSPETLAEVAELFRWYSRGLGVTSTARE